MTGLASVLRLNGELTEAETLLRQALALNRKARGENHANNGTTLHDLALVVAAQGDYPGAESLLRQALQIHERALGTRHPTVAVSLNALAHVLAWQRRHAEAAVAQRDALEIARPALGSTHQLVAIYTINLGSVQQALNNPADAETSLREGLRVRMRAPGIVPSRRRTFPEDDWSVPAIRSLLGAALSDLGRREEAETELTEALRDLKAMAVPPRQEIATTINRLVTLYGAWHKPEKAALYRSQLTSS
jgi:serine/threonine-protein kinase